MKLITMSELETAREMMMTPREVVCHQCGYKGDEVDFSHACCPACNNADPNLIETL